MIIFLIIFQLWANEVVVQDQKTSDLVYEKYLIEHPGSQSYIQHYRSENKDQKERLLNYLKTAQFEFLNSNLEQAKIYFKKMTDTQHQSDWGENERKAIHFAFFRLAQLETSPNRQDELLKQALVFSDYQPDNKLFPPPLLKRYFHLRKKQIKQVWPLPEKASHFTKIFINGQEQRNLHSFVKTFNSMQRITFLSNSYHPISVIMKPENLKNLKLTPLPLAQGHCHNPQFNMENMNLRKKWVYLQEDCSSQPQGYKQEHFMAQKVHAPATQPLASKKAFYKNKWFLIALAVVATGAAYSVIDRQNQKNAPAAQNEPVVQTFSN